MGVSVVVPCLNEEKYISLCLDGLINNGYDTNELEILVVDGGSTDQTLKILRLYTDKYPFIKIIHNKDRITPYALNLGLKNATYQRVLVAGAHAFYPKNYISSLNQLLNNPDIDAAGGVLQTKVKNLNAKSEAICFVLSHRMGVGNSIFRIGATELTEVDTIPFGLYEKSIFDKVGLYNEKLIRNHDMELSSRIRLAGYRIWMDPSLMCTYFARETFKELAINNYKNGYWNLKTLIITQKIASLSLRHYVPLLFILSLILPLLLVPFLGYIILWFSFVSAFLYFTLIGLISFKAKGINTRFLFFAFITLHFAYGFGSIAAGLSGVKFWK